ncbi:hypothetical protein SS50377_24365 [Spironucleus salmonicida]|uniref:Uncharacterized protein n=1 Tax=Spironucleus salmonicida TaxID=348837 RepID=V6LZ23_9EUKA|nr:hypothetical protein SS50377_24365 [Spironucleus salmonicida]|eukprot:EST46084.1 Hypothetical protein SS50377_14074 [Spironucleus salmonicida]
MYNKYFVPHQNSGILHSEHVRRLEGVQRRLLQVEKEPVARSSLEFYNPNDAFLLNQDLYRINRTEYLTRTSSKKYPYAQELRQISRRIEETIFGVPFKPKPKFVDFYWTPQVGHQTKDPLDYSKKLYNNRRVQNSYYFNHSKNNQVQQTIDYGVNIPARPYSNSPSPEICLTESERDRLINQVQKSYGEPVQEMNRQQLRQDNMKNEMQHQKQGTPSPPRMQTLEASLRDSIRQDTGNRSLLKANDYLNPDFEHANDYNSKTAHVAALYRQNRVMDQSINESRFVEQYQ